MIPIYISILRGINVGGKRKIIMAELKSLYIDLGFSDVVTYIQSGNVIFKSKQNNITSLESKIENAILEKYGFSVPVIVISQNEFEKCVSLNPFVQESVELNRLHVTFLKEQPKNILVDEFNKLKFENDQFKIMGKFVYLFCPIKYSDSKLTNNLFEKKLKVVATTRSWKTLIKILEIADK